MALMIMSEQQKNKIKKHWWQWLIVIIAVALLLFSIYVDLDCQNNDVLPAGGGAGTISVTE